MTNLIERLRQFDKAFDEKYEYEIAHEAADRIEKLEAECEKKDERIAHVEESYRVVYLEEDD